MRARRLKNRKPRILKNPDPGYPEGAAGKGGRSGKRSGWVGQAHRFDRIESGRLWIVSGRFFKLGASESRAAPRRPRGRTARPDSRSDRDATKAAVACSGG